MRWSSFDFFFISSLYVCKFWLTFSISFSILLPKLIKELNLLIFKFLLETFSPFYNTDLFPALILIKSSEIWRRGDTGLLLLILSISWGILAISAVMSSVPAKDESFWFDNNNSKSSNDYFLLSIFISDRNFWPISVIILRYFIGEDCV